MTTKNMHDFELVEHARLAVASAGPRNYQALCVLVGRLCDEIERIERLRMRAGLDAAVQHQSIRDLMGATRELLSSINRTSPLRTFDGTELPFNVLRLAYAKAVEDYFKG